MMLFLIIVGIILALVLIALLVYKESKGFVVEHYDFSSDKILEDFHFVFLSDLHEVQHGDKNSRLLEAIKKINPSYVLIGGDVITSYKMIDESFDDTLSFVETLAELFPVIFVPGNHERALFDIRDCEINPKPSDKDPYDIERINRFESCLKKNNVPILRNDSIYLKEYNVSVYGLDLGLEYYRRIIRNAPEEKCIINLLGEVDETSCSIMLAHDPEHFKEYSSWGCDFVLSGHLHGGIIRVPLLGGLISPQLRIFPKYDSGVFSLGRTKLLLTRGIGTHSVPIRVFNKAEVCDVVIKRQLGE